MPSETDCRFFNPARGNNRSFLQPMLISLALILSILFGAAVALFDNIIGVALGALVVGAALLSAPRATVWVTVVGGLVVAGLVELYLPSFQVVRWVFAILSIALAVISAVNRLAKNCAAPVLAKGTAALSSASALFVFAVLLSIIVSGAPLSNSVVGLKNYFQMWGVALALAWLGYKPVDATRFLRGLGFLALIQMPFALHEFLVLVPLRSSAIDAARNIVAVDVVAGTFGGSMQGGGRSADLAVLAAIAVTLFFAHWKAGTWRLVSTLLLSALAFAPIMLNEAKLALVLLPVGFFLLFRSTITKRPFAWIFGASALAACISVIIILYSMLPGADSQGSKSVGDYLSSSIEYNVGEKGYGGAVLNRTTVYRFWWQEHQRVGDLMHGMLGHGPGFSNAAAIARGDNPMANRYVGYAIGLTGFSSLLWDIGLAGTGVFLLMLFAAYRLGQRLTEKWCGTIYEPYIHVAQIGIVMMLISLLHNDYVVFDVGFQTMLAIFIGYLLAMAKTSREDAC